MIVKISRGAGIKGLVRYAFNGDKRTKSNKGAVIVGGTCSGLSQAQIMAELSMTRKLRPGIERPAWHCSLSLAPGEHLEDWQWGEITEEFMKRMGFSEFSLYSVIKHHDTEHEHVHIIASRIDLNGAVFHGKWEAKKALIAANDLAREYGLREVGKDAPRKSLKKGELEMGIRTGVKPPKLRLQNAIDSIIEPGMSAVEFAEKLTAVGIAVRANIATTGTMSGFSFELDGIAFKGSSLGKEYTWAGLQKRGVEYDKERDGKKLARWGVVRADQNSDGVSEPGRAPGAGPGEPDGRDQRVDDARPAGGPGDSGRGEIGPRRGTGPVDMDTTPTAPAPSDPSASVAADSSRVSNGVSLDRVNDSVGVVADLAPIRPNGESHGSERLDSSTGNPPTLAPDHVAKISAWRRQHEALGAPAYRLTLVPRLDADRSPINLGKSRVEGEPERFWTADEVEAKIPELRRRNAMGWDVYITPISQEYHYVLVDDIKRAAYDEFRKGYSPALIQSSSPDNVQAILKVPKLARKDEQSLANKVMSEINKRFGDPKISGVIHPFRMAGFMNTKPEKARIENGRRLRPMTEVLAASGQSCAKASGYLEALRQQGDTLAAQKTASRQARSEVAQAQTAPSPRAQANGTAAEAYRGEVARIQGLARKKGWVVDMSRVDLDAAKRLLRAGFSDREVRLAMETASPDISRRHKDVSGYVARTVERAASALESQAKRSDNQEEDGLKM
jgi:hypothetical protein